jgi:hypothetical protein
MKLTVIYTGAPHSIPLRFKEGIRMFEAVGFSICGLYFLVRQRFADVPDVVLIPPWLLEQTFPQAPGVSPSTSASLPLNTSLALTTALTNAKTLLAPTGSGSSQLWDVNTTTGELNGLAVRASESDVYLTSTSGSVETGQGLRLVSLPRWRGAGETTQRIVLPESENDKLKISTDVDTQSLCIRSAYQLSQAGGGLPPATIFRDPRFITTEQPSIGVSSPAGLPVLISNTPRQRNKRRLCVGEGTGGGEEDPSKRRR